MSIKVGSKVMVRYNDNSWNSLFRARVIEPRIKFVVDEISESVDGSGNPRFRYLCTFPESLRDLFGIYNTFPFNDDEIVVAGSCPMEVYDEH